MVWCCLVPVPAIPRHFPLLVRDYSRLFFASEPHDLFNIPALEAQGPVRFGRSPAFFVAVDKARIALACQSGSAAAKQALVFVFAVDYPLFTVFGGEGDGEEFPLGSGDQFVEFGCHGCYFS